MRKRIFIYEFVWSKDLIEHIIKVCKEKDLEICAWAIRKKDFKILLEVWPEAPILEAPLPKDLTQLNNDINLLEGFNFGEEENIRYLLDREGNYQNNMHASQVRYQIQSWADGIITNFRPDWLLFPDVPHNIFTYLIYLCGKRRGIKSQMIRRDLAPHLFNLSSTVERYPIKIPENSNEITASTQTVDYLNSLRASNNTDPTYMRKQRKNAKKINIIKRAFGKGLNLFTRKSIGAIGTYKKRSDLKKYYESLATIDNSSKHDKPYIAVFLMLQPERSSIPEGGIFAQQWLMIQMLSDYCLKNDWNLYIKEHPSTFMIGPKLYRGKWFYDGIISLPNVSLVSINLNSGEVLKGAKAIATITGTVGIESVAKGVPSLLFGESPYIGCEGTFRINNRLDLERAFSALQKEVYINFDEVVKFFAVSEHDEYCLNTGLSRTEDHVAPWMRGEPQAEMFSKIVQFIEKENE